MQGPKYIAKILRILYNFPEARAARRLASFSEDIGKTFILFSPARDRKR